MSGRLRNMLACAVFLVGWAVSGGPAVAGPVVEKAQRTEGIVTAVDFVDRTITVDNETYLVPGGMPDLRPGERVIVTYLSSNGRLIAWFRPVPLKS